MEQNQKSQGRRDSQNGRRCVKWGRPTAWGPQPLPPTPTVIPPKAQSGVPELGIRPGVVASSLGWSRVLAEDTKH